MTELELRNHYIDTLRGWIGRNEGDGSFKVIIDTYNSLTPLPRGYRMTYKDAWCAATVSAAAIEAGLTDIIFRECSCVRMVELFKQHDRWMENDAYIPKIADIVFYDWGDSGKGDCTGNPEHVGVVERLQIQNGSIVVIEGNYHDAVGRRTVKIDGRYIRGYGIPDYASLADAAPYQVRVTSDMLRIRPAPDNLSDFRGYFEFGNIVTISAESNGWGQVVGGDWIALKFVERISHEKA